MTEHEHDSFIAAIAKELREPVRLDAGLDAKIMRALEPAVIALDSRRPHVPWYRRTFALPAGGLAAAAALAGVAAIGTLVVQQGSAPTASPVMELRPAANTPVDPASVVVPTQFILPGDGQQTVAVVGDFNDWDPTRAPMQFDSATGAWEATVSLAPGLYQYQFLINGTERVNDPSAPQVSGDFGSANSIITVRASR